MGERRFVYVVRNQDSPPRYYVGVTEDVAARLDTHNAGGCTHTAAHRPWSRHVVIEFADEAHAVRFERYLKSGSGRAFAKRHFEGADAAQRRPPANRWADARQHPAERGSGNRRSTQPSSEARCQRSDGWAQKNATRSPAVFTPPRNGFEVVSRIERPVRDATSANKSRSISSGSSRRSSMSLSVARTGKSG